ncbi:MAG: hypothetical protein HN909_08690, partial [Phycisphaerales bacterium]|nr:hypothetical protein [Phycisphaerales bacterium]
AVPVQPEPMKVTVQVAAPAPVAAPVMTPDVARSIQEQKRAAEVGTPVASYGSGDTAILSEFEQRVKVVAEQTRHDFDALLKKSRELMAHDHDSGKLTSADFEKATALATQSLTLVQNNRSRFSATEYRGMVNEVNRETKRIQAKKKAWELWDVEKQREDHIKMVRIRTKVQLANRAKKIKELTSQALSLRRDRKYVAALRVIEEILILDPDNPWARDNEPTLRNFILTDAARRNEMEILEQTTLQSADFKRSEIPWYKILRYPRNWKELSKIREGYNVSDSSESEADRATRQKLDRKMGDVQLVDATFFDAIGYIREHTGANLYVNWGRLEVDNPDIRNQRVTVQLTNVAARTVLEKVLEEGSVDPLILDYVIQDGIVDISTTDLLDQRTITRTYPILDIMARSPSFRGPRVDVDSIGQNKYVDGGSQIGTSTGSSSSGGGSSSSLFDETDDVGKPEEELTKADMANKVKRMIMKTVDRTTWAYVEGEEADGTGEGTMSELSGTLVISQTAKNHRKIRDLLSSLREAHTIQIAIEARFIEVRTGFLNQVGVDLDVYFNMDSPITPTRLEDVGLLYTPGTSKSSMSPIFGTQNSDGFTNMMSDSIGSNVPNGLSTTLAGSPSAIAIAGTFLDDIQVDFLIRATQAYDSTRVLTAPRVTLLNGQRGYVSVATQQAYISGIEPVVANNSVGYRPHVSYAPTGTMLDVDATVSHDRRYVRLTIRPQIVKLNNMTNQGSVGLPNISMQDIQTSCSIPDGGTLLLGGLRLSTETEREMGVPVLSKIPVLNRFFTNKGKIRDESTLLILVKPKIIINEDEEVDPTNYQESETVPKTYSRHR